MLLFLNCTGMNIKGLHQTEDLTCVNQQLLIKLRQGEKFNILCLRLCGRALYVTLIRHLTGK